MDTSGVIRDHSKVKLAILKRYVPTLVDILCLSNQWSSIKVYDAFCGKGFTDAGEVGSAVILFEEILTKASKYPKHFKLVLNDIDPESLLNIKQYTDSKLSQSRIVNFEVVFENKDAQTFLKNEILLSRKIPEFKFLFYDPYNYRVTSKELLSDFLNAGRSEVLIFFPFSHIYRFLKPAREKKYNDSHGLVTFLKENLGENHRIFSESVTENEFLLALEEAYSINGFRHASVLIQEKQNKYALVFLTKSFKGIDVFLQGCYRKMNGESFQTIINYSSEDQVLTLKVESENGQIDLLENNVVGLDKLDMYLTKDLFKELKGSRLSNEELYYFILGKKLLPKHVSDLIYDLRNSNLLTIKDGYSTIISTKRPGLFLNSKPNQVLYYEFL